MSALLRIRLLRTGGKSYGIGRIHYTAGDSAGENYGGVYDRSGSDLICDQKLLSVGRVLTENSTIMVRDYI